MCLWCGLCIVSVFRMNTSFQPCNIIPNSNFMLFRFDHWHTHCSLFWSLVWHWCLPWPRHRDDAPHMCLPLWLHVCGFLIILFSRWNLWLSNLFVYSVDVASHPMFEGCAQISHFYLLQDTCWRALYQHAGWYSVLLQLAVYLSDVL